MNRPSTDIEKRGRGDHTPDSGGTPWRLGSSLFLEQLREGLRYDLAPAQWLIGQAGLALGIVAYAAGRRLDGLRTLCRVHSAGLSESSRRASESFIRGLYAHPSARAALCAVFDQYRARPPEVIARRFIEQPTRLFGSSLMVLKRARDGEKGVLVLNYPYVYGLFARLFDVARVQQRYYIVLEFAWSGVCDLDVLQFGLSEDPIFVETLEPRDHGFLRALGRPFVPVPVSTNSWVDYRVFRPLSGATKELDVCMIAAWAAYKRHSAFFRALQTARRRGRRLRTVLVGYPMDRTKDMIYAQARYYGVADQIEIHEWLSPTDVNVHLNRAKVHVLWSRREGVNRAIIEALFADVPVIVRSGFNYGFPYPYINAHTGQFVDEPELPDKLVAMVDSHDTYSPRSWVMTHMTSRRNTTILSDVIKAHAVAAGAPWTEDLVAKVSELNGLRYWDANDAVRFRDDYDYLATHILRGPRP
jgi:glycosyltransferase involved in cell wall biosynthesis